MVYGCKRRNKTLVFLRLFPVKRADGMPVLASLLHPDGICGPIRLQGAEKREGHAGAEKK